MCFILNSLTLGASCLTQSPLHTLREDGKAAKESQDSFKKKFSKTAYGTSAWGNLEIKNVQSAAESRKISPVRPYGCNGEEQTE